MRKLETAQAELKLTKQGAKQEIDALQASMALKDQYYEAKDTLREQIQPAPQEPREEVDLTPILDAINAMKETEPREPAQPVQVFVDAGNKPKIKTGRAVKQADGSWTMESTEQEAE